MAWLAKSRQAAIKAHAAGAVPTAARPVAAAFSSRASNGLKEFLWLLNDVEHGRLLDLGPVWQSTVGFFTERGFRVSTDDLLRTWKDFCAAEEARLREAAGSNNGLVVPREEIADRFLEYSLAYPPEDFHAILAWDLFDYVDDELLPRVVARLYDLLRPGGLVLGVFHSRTAEKFHRYRILDPLSLELVPAPGYCPHRRIFQNREILNLFGQFRSSKTFVGRDQVREGLFVK